MFIKNVRKKCMIRGCRCTNSFAVSRSSELGNTIIMCDECALDFLTAVALRNKGEEVVLAVTEVAEVEKLPHIDVEPIDNTLEGEGETQIDGEVFACPDCGKVCKTANGLVLHKGYCKGAVE